MTRQEAEKIIWDNASEELKDELNYRLHIVEREGDYDIFDALADVDYWTDTDDPADKKMQREVIQIHIALGYLVPVSDEDVRERVQCGLGVRMRDFPKVAKQRYEYVGAWSLWVEKLG